MTLGPVAAAPLVASGTSGHVSNPIDHAAGTGLDAQLQVDEGDAAGIAGDAQLSDARTTFHGEAANDSLGETVVGIGDVTADGTDDVALGAPEAADGAGAVYHFFGPVAGGDLDASEADLTLTGEAPGDWAGADVTAADLTDDGLRDLIVGAPRANAGMGAVYVFYGADLRAAVDDGASEVSLADASVTMTGDGEGDQFGTAVAAHGHEHAGDDAPMLAVGAPGADREAGAVYTFSDVSSEATAADADAVVTGAAEGDQAGWSLATADNYTDAGDAALIVGAPQHDGTGAVGILTDVSGDASLADADRLLLGEGDGDRAGWAVDEAGDVDGDGLTDVVIGAPLNDAAAEDAGAAYVLHASSHQAGSTNLADADAIVRGEQAGDTAGYDVSAAGSGDVTCDEYDDVLVGAPGHDANGQQDAGAAYIVAGGQTLQGDYSLSTAQAKLHGENAGDLAGFSVADAMDVTDNGDEDLLVGAPGADKNAGAAYLVEGECPADGVEEEPRTDEPVVEEPDKEEPKEEEPKEEEPTEEDPADKEDRDEDVDEDDKEKDVDQDAGDDRDEDDDKDKDVDQDTEDDKDDHDDDADKDGGDGQDGDVGDDDGDDGDDKDGDDGDGEPQQPDVSISPAEECGQVTVTLHNAGEVEYPFSVDLKVQGEVVGSVTYEEGDDATQTIDVDLTDEELEDGRTINVFLNGDNRLGELQFTLQCETGDDGDDGEPQQPVISVAAAEECGQVTVTLNNPGEVEFPVSVDLRVQGDSVGSVTFEEGDDATQTIEVALSDEEHEDGRFINVFVNGDRAGELQFELQCDTDDDGDGELQQPDVSVAAAEECGDVTITLNNPDEVEYPVSVDLRVQGDNVGTVTFGEGDAATQTITTDLTEEDLEDSRVINVFVNGDRASGLQFTLQCDGDNGSSPTITDVNWNG